MHLGCWQASCWVEIVVVADRSIAISQHLRHDLDEALATGLTMFWTRRDWPSTRWGRIAPNEVSAPRSATRRWIHQYGLRRRRATRRYLDIRVSKASSNAGCKLASTPAKPDRSLIAFWCCYIRTCYQSSMASTPDLWTLRLLTRKPRCRLRSITITSSCVAIGAHFGTIPLVLGL